MKKLLLSILLAVAAFAADGSLQKVQKLESYLLSKNFTIGGSFHLYKGAWYLEVKGARGSIYYKLLGTKSTPSNPFGWKREDIAGSTNLSSALGYFIYIGYPGEDRNFSWLYVDSGSGAIYKLVGADGSTFHYLDIDGDGTPDPLPGIYFAKNGNEALFFSCHDSIDYSLASVKMAKYSKFEGAVAYDCHYLTANPYHLFKTLQIKDIKKVQKIEGEVNGKKVQGSITKEYAKGEVHIEGTFAKRYINCYEYYKPFKGAKIEPQKSENLRNLLEKWGEKGNCNDELLDTTCPAAYYDAYSRCDEDKEPNVTKMDIAILTSYTLTENDESNDTITLFTHTKIGR